MNRRMNSVSFIACFYYHCGGGQGEKNNVENVSVLTVEEKRTHLCVCLMVRGLKLFVVTVWNSEEIDLPREGGAGVPSHIYDSLLIYKSI